MKETVRRTLYAAIAVIGVIAIGFVLSNYRNRDGELANAQIQSEEIAASIGELGNIAEQSKEITAKSAAEIESAGESNRKIRTENRALAAGIGEAKQTLGELRAAAEEAAELGNRAAETVKVAQNIVRESLLIIEKAGKE